MISKIRWTSARVSSLKRPTSSSVNKPWRCVLRMQIIALDRLKPLKISGYRVAIFDQLVDRQIPLVRGQGGLGGFDSDFLKNALAKPVEKNRLQVRIFFQSIQECRYTLTVLSRSISIPPSPHRGRCPASRSYLHEATV